VNYSPQLGMANPGPKKRIESRLTISLVKGQRKRLIQYVGRDGGSLACVIRTALNDFLERNPGPQEKGSK